MLLKLTSAPDETGRTVTVAIIDDVAAVEFQRTATGHLAVLKMRSGDTSRYEIAGNAYVMTDDGQTIDKVFHPARR